MKTTVEAKLTLQQWKRSILTKCLRTCHFCEARSHQYVHLPILTMGKKGRRKDDYLGGEFIQYHLKNGCIEGWYTDANLG
eukprot:1327479-Amphidinium_carterae.1